MAMFELYYIKIISFLIEWSIRATSWINR